MSALDLLASAKCYVCQGVSLGEALELALLAQIVAAPPITPPVLSFTFPNLSWTFTGANPDHWSIQEAASVNGPWTEVDTAAGSARSAQFLDSGVLARIVGMNASNVQIIAPSNSVVIP